MILISTINVFVCRWSFGVLLWEIATLGKPPFAAVDPLTLLDKLKNGHRLEQPLGCPDSL